MERERERGERWNERKRVRAMVKEDRAMDRERAMVREERDGGRWSERERESERATMGEERWRVIEEREMK